MSSEKQIAANRENALKGGVKTEAGKAVSSLNAISHGIFSRDVLLPGENSCLLVDLQNKLLAEIQPVGELETVLERQIYKAMHELERLQYARKGSPAPESVNPDIPQPESL